MRGPKCGYLHIASAIERTAAVVVLIATEVQTIGLPVEVRRHLTPEMRARLAELELTLHQMRDHLESCEDCEQP